MSHKTGIYSMKMILRLITCVYSIVFCENNHFPDFAQAAYRIDDQARPAARSLSEILLSGSVRGPGVYHAIPFAKCGGGTRKVVEFVVEDSGAQSDGRLQEALGG